MDNFQELSDRAYYEGAKAREARANDPEANPPVPYEIKNPLFLDWMRGFCEAHIVHRSHMIHRRIREAHNGTHQEADTEDSAQARD